MLQNADRISYLQLHCLSPGVIVESKVKCCAEFCFEHTVLQGNECQMEQCQLTANTFVVTVTCTFVFIIDIAALCLLPNILYIFDCCVFCLYLLTL